MSKSTSQTYCAEVRDRAVRLALEGLDQHPLRWSAITSVTSKGGSAHTLHDWLRKAELASGQRGGLPPETALRLKALKRENRELRQANEILRKASAYFRSGGVGPPVQAVMEFIEEHRAAYGVEPICRILQVAPSGWYERQARRRNPARQPARAKRDAELKP